MLHCDVHKKVFNEKTVLPDLSHTGPSCCLHLVLRLQLGAQLHVCVCMNMQTRQTEVIIKLKLPSTSQLSVPEKKPSLFKCRDIYHLSKSRIPGMRCEQFKYISERTVIEMLADKSSKTLTQNEKMMKQKSIKDMRKIPLC